MHARGDPHNHAMTLYWKVNLKNEVELADKFRDKNQETITSGIASMQASEMVKTKKKLIFRS